MAKGIELLFTAQNDDVLRKSGEIQEGLEDVNDELGDVTDGSNDTERALEKLGDAGEDAGRKTSDGLDEAGTAAEGVGEKLSEAGGIAKDVLTGDVAGAAEGATSTLAGLAGVAGGIGGAIGAGVGAAVQFVTDQVQAQIEKVAELKGRYAELYQSAAEDSRTYLEQAQITAAAQDILFDTGKMDEYRDAAARIGVDVNTYVLAQAGSYSDLQVVIEAAAAAEQARIDEIDSARGGEAYDSEVQAISRIRDELALLQQSHVDGQAAAAAAAQIREQLSSDERAAIDQNQAADAARWEAYAAAAGAAIASVPKEQTVVVKADFSQAERDIASFQRQQRYANVEVQLTRNGEPVY